MAKAKAERSEPKPKSSRARKKAVEPASRGLTAVQAAAGTPPAKVAKLQQAVEDVGV